MPGLELFVREDPLARLAGGLSAQPVGRLSLPALRIGESLRDGSRSSLQSSNFASKHFAMSAPLSAIRSDPPIPRLLNVTVDPSADVVFMYSETAAPFPASREEPSAGPGPGREQAG